MLHQVAVFERIADSAAPASGGIEASCLFDSTSALAASWQQFTQQASKVQSEKTLLLPNDTGEEPNEDAHGDAKVLKRQKHE